jgi:hypothetical protein
MEHPLIGSLDEFTAEQLLDKITELNRKLTIAMRMGNSYLCNQLRMAIESHQVKYQEKTQAMFNKGKSGDNFEDKIDIS